MEPIEPFYVGAMFPGGVVCDYYFNVVDGFYRRRHDGQTIERWTGSGWAISELLTEAFGLAGEVSDG